MRYDIHFYNKAGERFSTCRILVWYLSDYEIARQLKTEIEKNEAHWTEPITWKIFHSNSDVTEYAIDLITEYFPRFSFRNQPAPNEHTQFANNFANDWLKEGQPAPAASLDPFDQSFDTLYALAKRIGDSRFGSECQHEKGPGGYCTKCRRLVR